ncbi:MAG: 2Fe-2S iron-sulfur cluster-binding protein [Rhodoferax sp.]|nr:2Fe-2S iron-sulfur cluster-binding protein [Rhodoferax sp.]
MLHQVTIENTGETFRCGGEDNLLKAMEQLRCKGIPVGCRNGGCGVCKVRVIEGRYARKKMSRAVISAEEEEQGCVLACKIQPQSDLRVEVVGKMVRAVVARRSTSFSFEFSTTLHVFQPDKET